MSDAFFDELGLRKPDENLQIGSGTQAEQTAKALIGIERALSESKPDVSLVQGDTNAVLSAALASVKLQIPVGHVEAGLRSYDVRMPEEHNRRLTDHASKYLFAPTEQSAEILRKESVWGKIFVTGNTVIDMLQKIIPKAREQPDPIEKLGLDEFVLLTLHRAENVDNRDTLKGIIEGIFALQKDIVFAAHPRTVTRLNEFDLMKTVQSNEKVHIIRPPAYLDFLNLVERCSFVMTDSGGIQEEVTAPSINKRVFVLRTSTERPEAVDSGHAMVVGVSPSDFPKMILDACEKKWTPKKNSPYGSGDAAKKIVKILEKEFR
jgi:UDP-N-acetylglucosamine 2-epimerase (non-hydrolysing)